VGVKKFLKISIGAMAVLTISAVLVSAVLAAVGGSPDSSPVKEVEDVVNIIGNIVVLMYRAFFIVAISAVIWAAFTYLRGGDDPEKIKSATKQIMWAAVAIAIALVSVGAAKILDQFLQTGK